MLRRVAIRVVSRLLRRLLLRRVVRSFARVTVGRHGLSRRRTRMWLRLLTIAHVLLLLIVLLSLLPPSIHERLLCGSE